MHKGELILSFLIFLFIYVFSSPAFVPSVLADENQTNMTHLECVNRACIPVNNTINGTNVDLCRTTFDCNQSDVIQAVRANRTISINLTHLECANQACVQVNGTGADLCQTNAQCNLTNMTRRICISQACVLVNATEINGTVIDCLTDLDCQNNTGGGGNQSNRSSGGGGGGDLPLAPPIQPQSQQPRTLASIIWRAITSIF